MIKEGSVNKKTYSIKISGLVQGVGFRPFVYRLAHKHKLCGWVENRNDGVNIKINASKNTFVDFKEDLIQFAPISSEIHVLKDEIISFEHFDDFIIKKSENVSSKITEVSPDIAVCENCLLDMKEQQHRTNYPLINCTNCGPRFSIIRDLPYDRKKTTMANFEMCSLCTKEYKNVLDRRFHAQPVACNNCGPTYRLLKDHTRISGINKIIKEISQGVAEGKVFAIKGTGGFHLMCDALNNKAVQKVREIKKRDKKPFAVMFHSIKELKKYAFISEGEEKTLKSWRRPIVLLKKKKKLANGIADNMNTIGVLLPYMPFHYLLFKKLNTPVVVLTSGNISGEPIIISDKEAEEKIASSVEGIITYNRDIHNRTDDSVIQIINKKTNIIRRSRGYAPSSIITNINTEGIIAVGAELVNSFCLGKENLAILSQYIGDLKNTETLRFFEETYARFKRLYKFTEEIIVCDLHPDYLSTQFAEKLAEKTNSPLLKIQHHHAHIASVLCDQGLDEKVMGISLDGIGLGTDEHIWGGEFLIADLVDFKRKFHLEYIPMPGGDMATKEPWRMALSYLYRVFGTDSKELNLPFLNEIPKNKITIVTQMIEKGINSPLTSSVGRLFDAVSSILGLINESRYHAEAPMLLESIIDEKFTGSYEFQIQTNTISFNQCIKQITEDKLNNISNSAIATKFHNTIIKLIIEIALILKKQTGINKVILSGGTFQNKYIVLNAEILLVKAGFDVYLPRKIPINDQGIALGQLAIAAKRREMNLL
jgi:hydrogenase maturation protein HypF